MAPWNVLVESGRRLGHPQRDRRRCAGDRAARGPRDPRSTNLETGPVSPALLPKDDPARVSYDKISAVMGPGFTTPFNVVVVSRDKPITDRAMLREIDAFQAEIAGRQAREVGRRPG